MRTNGGPPSGTFGGAGNYTVQPYLKFLKDQYGGIDSVLLWPTYTNIGADDRNQFELIESLPGGLDGVRAVIDELHASGVNALWPYNPWDQGTHGGSDNHTQAGIDDAARLAALLKGSNGDGFFGDTISSSGLEEFYNDALADGHPTAIQPEAGGTIASMNFTSMGWGYWKYPSAPPVDMLKWLDQRWLTQVCDRWSRDKTNLFQLAWFNGDGVETWQNIWGIWQGITARDGAALRRVGAMTRHFGKSHGFLQSKGWVPHTPMLQQPQGIYASMWPLGLGDPNSTDSLWTIVNRGSADVAGAQINIGADARSYFDCYHGVPLHPGPYGTLSFEVEVGGVGCVLALTHATMPTHNSSNHTAFLASMRALTRQKLSSFSKRWTSLQQTMLPVARTGTLGGTALADVCPHSVV